MNSARGEQRGFGSVEEVFCSCWSLDLCASGFRPIRCDLSCWIRVGKVCTIASHRTVDRVSLFHGAELSSWLAHHTILVSHLLLIPPSILASFMPYSLTVSQYSPSRPLLSARPPRPHHLLGQPPRQIIRPNETIRSSPMPRGRRGNDTRYIPHRRISK